jgi:hypothetical protein
MNRYGMGSKKKILNFIQRTFSDAGANEKLGFFYVA